jgi:hypothetical protein
MREVATKSVTTSETDWFNFICWTSQQRPYPIDFKVPDIPMGH